MELKKKRLKIKKIIVPTNCPFCKNKNEPHFIEFDVLKNYLTERGKIQGKDRTGLCAKHQRHLTIQIKRARIVSLLPFVSGLS